MKRWDLTERGALEPMEETPNGDWALYDEAEAEVAARAQTIKQLAQELGISEGALASATQDNERLRKALSGRLQDLEEAREGRAAAIDRLTPLGCERNQFRKALEMIRDGQIPQAMSPALFAESVLEQPVPQSAEHSPPGLDKA